MDYLLDDYVAAFHTALNGMLMRRGIQLASEGHFNNDVNNVHDLAIIAAKKIFQERNRHATKVPAPVSIPMAFGELEQLTKELAQQPGVIEPVKTKAAKP